APPGRDAAARIRRAGLVLLAGPEPGGRTLPGHLADTAEQLPRAAILRAGHAARRAADLRDHGPRLARVPADARAERDGAVAARGSAGHRPRPKLSARSAFR